MRERKKEEKEESMAKKKAKKAKWMAENPGMGQSYNHFC